VLSRRLAANAALLVSIGSLVALPASAAGAAAAASAAGATTILVDTMSPYCSDTSAMAGSATTPYCTIQAAANAATAGATVEIFGGAANAVSYPEDVTITHSGTAAAPITFESIGHYARLGSVLLPAKGGTLTVQGASYVNLVVSRRRSTLRTRRTWVWRRPAAVWLSAPARVRCLSSGTISVW